MSVISSWGKSFHTQSDVLAMSFSSERPDLSKISALPVGKMRSYGDVCLNDGESIIDCSAMKHILEFSSEGIITLEGGASIDDLLQFSVPRGWFIPVTPGTKFVTIAGAIANDIHGKNHHLSGTIGRFVKSLKVLRSDGEIITCSLDSNSEFFNATIAGLGLTGVILEISLQLIPINNSIIDLEIIKFESLDEFFEINQESKNWTYTVSWLDCFSPKGKGHYIRGEHNPNKNISDFSIHNEGKLTVPFNLPHFCLNKFSMSLFNYVYFNKFKGKSIGASQNYDPFFYPLDSIHNWNRIYGKNGFFQFQCVIPMEKKNEFFKMFDIIKRSNQGSFLSVLKTFGNISSPGMLSFPSEGITLCLDFPNKGLKTDQLINELMDLTIKNGGRMYPAKDSHMSSDHFSASFSRIDEFKKYKDPNLSSSFWRRVTGE